jgi:hypothetical protein
MQGHVGCMQPVKEVSVARQQCLKINEKAKKIK